VFVQYVTEVEAGLGDVENSLDKVRSNLAEWADIAYRNGEKLQAKVGPNDKVARKVDLEIGGAEIHSMGLVYPIRWTATGSTLLFPELSADLILTERGPNRTTLTLKGNYQPPLGRIGQLADRAGLGHVAEATVRGWMDRLALALNPDSSEG
jgi:hypothetical protein